MILWRLSRSESSCKFLQNRGHFLSFGVCSSEWVEERFAYSLAWIHEKKRFFYRLTSCAVKRLLWKFFLTVFEYNVTWYGTLGISVKPYSFVFFHWSVNLCFCRKSSEYGDSRAVFVRQRVVTKTEMENWISGNGFTRDVLERKKKEKRRTKMVRESDILTY